MCEGCAAEPLAGAACDVRDGRSTGHASRRRPIPASRQSPAVPRPRVRSICTAGGAAGACAAPSTNSWAFTLDYKTIQWMQLDQNGDANSWPLGEFLAQDEVRAMMLDPACTKSLTFREFVNGPRTSLSRRRYRTPTTGPVHQPRRTMAPSTTSLHRRKPSPPLALGHPAWPPTACT